MDTAEKVSGVYSAKYNQMTVKLDGVERYHCRSCGEEYFTPEQERQFSRRVKAAAREQLGLLAPEVIISIRRRYGLSQEGLEQLLGVGAKVVTRWENDRVLQPRSVDDLLRLMDRNPMIVEELKALRQAVPVKHAVSA